jgi:hypothetical protein
MKNEGIPQTHTKSSTTQSTEHHAGPVLLDIIMDNGIMAAPMEWISNVWLINNKF